MDVVFTDSGWSRSQPLKILKWSNSYPTAASRVNTSNVFAGGRKPKMHQPASNGSLDLGIKKRQREGKGLAQFLPAAMQTKWI